MDSILSQVTGNLTLNKNEKGRTFTDSYDSKVQIHSGFRPSLTQSLKQSHPSQGPHLSALLSLSLSRSRSHSLSANAQDCTRLTEHLFNNDLQTLTKLPFALLKSRMAFPFWMLL